jgi:hypothetical protein
MNLQMRQPSRIAAATLCMVMLACSASAAEFSETKPGKERITINVKNKPLGEVLSVISQTTGYGFILDESWRGYPVTAYLIDTPLHSGLKRILSGLNHAIVYLPESRIKILILDGHSPGPAVPPSIGAPASKPPRIPAPSPSAASPGLPSKPPAGDRPQSTDPEPDETETDSGTQAGGESTQD